MMALGYKFRIGQDFERQIFVVIEVINLMAYRQHHWNLSSI